MAELACKCGSEDWYVEATRLLVVTRRIGVSIENSEFDEEDLYDDNGDVLDHQELSHIRKTSGDDAILDWNVVGDRTFTAPPSEEGRSTLSRPKCGSCGHEYESDPDDGDIWDGFDKP